MFSFQRWFSLLSKYLFSSFCVRVCYIRLDCVALQLELRCVKIRLGGTCFSVSCLKSRSPPPIKSIILSYISWRASNSGNLRSVKTPLLPLFSFPPWPVLVVSVIVPSMGQMDQLKTNSYSYILTLDQAVNQETKQVHPVKDIGTSPWPVDVVEFGADAYAHRKLLVKELYNQVPQMAWVSQFESIRVGQFEFQSQLESVVDKMPNWEPAADRG